MKEKNSLPEDEETDEQIFRMDELNEGIFDELSEELAEDDPQELITQLQIRIKTLEERLSQLEEKSSSGEGQFDWALEEYHRIMDRGREMAKEKLEQRKNDKTVYQILNTVARKTKKGNIEYGVKGEIRMKRGGRRVDPKPFEDTEILKVPKAIKKALRGQEKS